MRLQCLALLTLLSACSYQVDGEGDAQKHMLDAQQTVGVASVDTHRVSFWVDPDTGCQYLVTWTYKGGGITPRLDSYGDPICGRLGRD